MAIRSRRVIIGMTVLTVVLGLSSLATAFVTTFNGPNSYYQQGKGALSSMKYRIKRRVFRYNSMNNYLDFDTSEATGITTTTTRTDNRVPIVAGNWKLNPSTI